MPLQFNCKVHVEHPSEITIDDDGLAHIIDREGGMAIERVMDRATLRASAVRALAALEAYGER